MGSIIHPFVNTMRLNIYHAFLPWLIMSQDMLIVIDKSWVVVSTTQLTEKKQLLYVWFSSRSLSLSHTHTRYYCTPKPAISSLLLVYSKPLPLEVTKQVILCQQVRGIRERPHAKSKCSLANHPAPSHLPTHLTPVYVCANTFTWDLINEPLWSLWPRFPCDKTR